MRFNRILDNLKLPSDVLMLSYAQRAACAKHSLTKRLFMLMEEKQTNLVHNPDVTTKKEFLDLIDAVGPYVCAIKTHIDIIADFDWDLIEKLLMLAQKHRFLIIEDRKFSDIGAIVRKQYTAGLYHIIEWADIVIAHAIVGQGLIDGLKVDGMQRNRGMFLIAQLSCAENTIDDVYTQKVIKLAEKNSDFVLGFIAQRALSSNPGIITITPGVSMVSTQDALSQRYNDPDTIISKHGSDAIVVGRAIYQSDDQRAMAQLYATTGWQAYQRRISLS